MQKMLESGKSIREIAERFGTTRQSISRYIDKMPEPGCTLRMTLMYQTHPCTIIDVNFMERKIYIQNRTDNMLHRAFGIKENPDWEDFEYFLRDRCFPPTRGNAKELLNILGIPGYDPLAIVEKTKGRTAEDNLWIKFKYYDACEVNAK